MFLLKLSNFQKIFLLFVLICLMSSVYCLFQTDTITQYGLINWYVSYNDGFSRRCLLASIYNLIKFLFDDNDADLSFVKNLHKLFLFLFFITILYFVLKSKHFIIILCCSFLFIASPATKNLIFLTGYTDVYLFFTVMLTVILIRHKFLVASFLCILVSGLIHELSFFLYLPIMIVDLYTTSKVEQKKYFISLLLCYSLGLISIVLIFKCNLDTNSLIKSLRKTITQEATLNTIYHSLNEHYSIFNLFYKRVLSLGKNYHNAFYAFILLSWQGLFCWYLFIYKNTNLTNYKKYLISFIALIPSFVIFFATDVWRFLCLYTYSIFILLVILDFKKLNIFISPTSFQKIIIVAVSFVISVFSICIPYQMITTEEKGFNGVPNETYKVILGNSVFVRYANKINLFYNYWNGLYDNYVSNLDRHCLKDGNKAMQLMLSPGLKNITIYSNPNNNSANSITLGRYKINLNGEIRVSFNFYSEETVVSTGAYIIYCNPTDYDWDIEKIEVKSIY